MGASVRILGNKICPYSQRTVISLLELGIDFDFVNVDFINPPSWLYKLSPLSTIPVLQTINSSIYDSSSIIEYVNEISLNKLLPYKAEKNANVRSVCSYIDHIHKGLSRCISSVDNGSYKESVKRLEKDLEVLFSTLIPDSYDALKLDMIRVYLIPMLVLVNILDTYGSCRITLNKRAHEISKILLGAECTKAINNTEYIKSILQFIFTTDRPTLNYKKGN